MTREQIEAALKEVEREVGPLSAWIVCEWARRALPVVEAANRVVSVEDADEGSDPEFVAWHAALDELFDAVREMRGGE